MVNPRPARNSRAPRRYSPGDLPGPEPPNPPAALIPAPAPIPPVQPAPPIGPAPPNPPAALIPAPGPIPPVQPAPPIGPAPPNPPAALIPPPAPIPPVQPAPAIGPAPPNPPAALIPPPAPIPPVRPARPIGPAPRNPPAALIPPPAPIPPVRPARPIGPAPRNPPAALIPPPAPIPPVQPAPPIGPAPPIQDVPANPVAADLIVVVEEPQDAQMRLLDPAPPVGPPPPSQVVPPNPLPIAEDVPMVEIGEEQGVQERPVTPPSPVPPIGPASPIPPNPLPLVADVQMAEVDGQRVDQEQNAVIAGEENGGGVEEPRPVRRVHFNDNAQIFPIRRDQPVRAPAEVLNQPEDGADQRQEEAPQEPPNRHPRNNNQLPDENRQLQIQGLLNLLAHHRQAEEAGRRRQDGGPMLPFAQFQEMYRTYQVAPNFVEIALGIFRLFDRDRSPVRQPGGDDVGGRQERQEEHEGHQQARISLRGGPHAGRAFRHAPERPREVVRGGRELRRVGHGDRHHQRHRERHEANIRRRREENRDLREFRGEEHRNRDHQRRHQQHANRNDRRRQEEHQDHQEFRREEQGNRRHRQEMRPIDFFIYELEHQTALSRRLEGVGRTLEEFRIERGEQVPPLPRGHFAREYEIDQHDGMCLCIPCLHHRGTVLNNNYNLALANFETRLRGMRDAMNRWEDDINTAHANLYQRRH
ncbi:hypothetical protein CAEBREN_13082 [Caenorhabditis brenneri]|uniref:Uncharacterized protein n=1 Tax=Caenorhabditis brenneri TaxID=135651 RepID=G0N7U8_CAEBE|nr:hypothetical protein CAEBREN_13082 [Caenorhabditis brenneri]